MLRRDIDAWKNRPSSTGLIAILNLSRSKCKASSRLMYASDLFLHRCFSSNDSQNDVLIKLWEQPITIVFFANLTTPDPNVLIPNAVGVIGMILIGRNSDKLHERRWHFVACVAIAAGGLGITTLLQGNLAASIVALSFAVIGIAAATPLFFTLITEYLSVAAAAVGIALISSLGNLGPAVSPSINGLIIQCTSSKAHSM